MEMLCDLLFEVSNEDRLGILKVLRDRALNVTNLAKELDLTNQECSRHVSRLGEVGLTWKDPEGLNHLTFYGEIVLRFLPGLEFVSGQREYFTTHTLRALPTEFVGRMGALSGSTYIDDVMVVFHNIEKVINEAEEYIWRLTDRILITSLDELEGAVQRGVEVRHLEPKNMVYPPNWSGPGPILAEASVKGTFINRLVESADVFIAMSEKEVAVVSFPEEDGRFDYLGFSSTDKDTHKWCKDVFEHFWSMSEKKTE